MQVVKTCVTIATVKTTTLKSQQTSDGLLKTSVNEKTTKRKTTKRQDEVVNVTNGGMKDRRVCGRKNKK